MVQRRNPGSSTWVDIGSPSREESRQFHGPVAGTYGFRSKVVRFANGAMWPSGWSKVVNVAVS